MMQELYEIKEKLVNRIEQEMDYGLERMDTNEAGKVIDMIKDLAEAEKCCWEACYYQSLVEAMDDTKGYMETSNRGYENNRMGYKNQYGSGFQGNNNRRGYESRMSGGMGGRRGYSGMQNLREEMRNASEEDRKRMRKEMEQVLHEFE